MVLNIGNANDAPTFSQTAYAIGVVDDTPIGAVVVEFDVTDPDGDTLTYTRAFDSIIGSYFTLDRDAGTLSLAQALPQNYMHSFYIQVSDETGGFAIARFTIRSVRDVYEVATYGFAVSGSAHDAPEPYLTLTATRLTDDPEGHNGAEIYEWFHVDAPDVVLDTGASYEVQESDVGKQLRFRVKYSDGTGNDEVVVGETSSIVVASGLGLTVAETRASITENVAGAVFSGIVFTPTLNDASIPALTADDFTVSGDQADKFEIRVVNTAFTLALKPGESLNYETADILTLNVAVNHEGSRHRTPDLTINVDNVDGEDASYFIDNTGNARTQPTLYTILTARQSTPDPDRLDFRVPVEIEWFHVGASNVVLDTGTTYQVQFSDLSKQINFRIKYSDLSVVDANSPTARVILGNLDLGASALGHIDENSAGAFSDINFAPSVNGILLIADVRAITSFHVTGGGDRFEVVQDGAVWKLKLKDTEMLNFEATAGDDIALNIIINLNGNESTAPLPVTISVGDVNEVATYGFAVSGSAHDAPEPYLTLAATRLTDDPEGHNGAEIYEWFHVDAPDVVLGTGASYEVQESDVGKRLRFGVKYSDGTGNDEVVVGETSSIVVASGLGLTVAETSASITENVAGAVFSSIVFTPTLNDASIPALTADDFTVSGDQADKFEIRVVNTAFTLALKPGESLNYETADMLTLNVAVNHDGSRHRTPDLTINVDNVDDGDASYFIDNTGNARTQPTLYTILTARQSTPDPDRLDFRVPVEIEWFHVGASDVVLDTGTTYQVQFSDLIKQINFRIKYSDLSGTDEVVDANSPTAGVILGNLDLGASATSATIDENSAGAFSDINFAPSVNGILLTADVRAITSFHVTGGGDRFEVVQDGAVWKLKLKDTEMLNFEATAGDIALNITINLNGNEAAAPLPVTISVGDVYEGDLGASATSATIDENSAGAFSGITFTPALNGTPFASNRVGLSISDDTIGADRFEIVLDGAVWKLKLKDSEMLDFEANSDDIILNVVFSLDGDVLGDPLPVTISVGNADEGHETLYLITPSPGRTNPEVGTILHAQRSPKPFRIDPDGHDDSVAEVFEWFHESDRDTVIGTGASYTVQESDIGEQLRFRAKYRDLSGTDEVAISSDRSISGVVTAARLVLGESATSGTIKENEGGAFSDITFTPTLDNVDIADRINANDFIVTSNEVTTNFAVRRDNGVWTLKIRNSEIFDAETAELSEFAIRVQLFFEAQYIAGVDLTINIGNVDEGDAHYFIAPGLERDAPEPGTILTAQRSTRPDRQDPDGYDDSVPVEIEWFHESDHDTVIGTGETYTVKTSDVGEQLRFRAKYRDGSETDEVVLSSDSSVSGVVVVNLLTLTLSADSTTINEDIAGAVSDIILTPDLGGIAITLTSDSFRITGDADANKFQIVPDAQNAGVWKLKLQDNVSLDAESVTSPISLNIAINQDGNTSAVQTLTVNVGNVDEGRETPYFIDNTGGVREAPQPGTILTAKRSANQNRQDPDGHDDSVADIFEWFHESDRDTVIGNGETYTVKTSDVGSQLRFRVTYRDLSGTDEVVLANEGSISGVVTLDGTARIALVASATTASIDEDTDGASTDIEFSVYDGAEYAFTSTDFTITGTESEHFEIARNQAGNWHLRLIDEHSLNYESITSLNLQVRVSDGTQQSNIIENIAISVTNQDDGDASIAINGADVEVGTRLGITFTPDPDGLMTGTTYTYDWFYARDPDTAIDTDVSYTIAEKDRGEYIGVKVTYTDTLGTQVVQHISDEPVPYVVITPDTPVKEDNTIQAEQDKASKVDAGDGADSIKDGKRNDVIIGGLGDDVIDLGGDSDGTDTDQVIYRIGDQTAADGGDRITNFNRGKDQFTFSLESNAETDKIEDYEDFLNYVNSGTPGVVKDDQFLVLLDIDYFAPTLTLEGLYLHFKDSSFFSDGRISMPLVNIKFAEGLTGDEFLKVFDEGVDISDVIDVNGLLRDLSYLDDLLGGEGSVSYEVV